MGMSHLSAPSVRMRGVLESWKRGHAPNEPSSLSEQHLADCGERSDARDGGGSQLHDFRILKAGGEVLLRVG